MQYFVNKVEIGGGKYFPQDKQDLLIFLVVFMISELRVGYNYHIN